MKLSSYLLFTTVTLCLLLSSSSDALAFGGRPGGPFSNGSYFRSDGTFSAVVRARGTDDLGEDFVVVGTLQFSSTSGSGPLSASTTVQQNQVEDATASQTTTETQGTGGVGSTGISAIYVSGSAFGNAYFGNSQGSFDPAGSMLTVAFQASAKGQGEQTVTQTGTKTLTSTSNGTINTTEEIVNTSILKYFDSFLMSGASICSTSNSFPNQKFSGSGKGEARRLDFTLGTAPVPKSALFDFSITGVRLSNTTSSFETKEVRPPSYNLQTILTNP